MYDNFRYNNCQISKTLRKSCSLPILGEFNKDLIKVNSQPTASFRKSSSSSSSSHMNKMNVIDLTYLDSENSNFIAVVMPSSKSSSTEEKKIIDTCSTSSIEDDLQKKHSFSSDSSSQRKFSDFLNTLSTLKDKVGLPEAHSTPYSSENNKNGKLLIETPLISKAEKSVRNVQDSQNSETKTNELINLIDFAVLPTIDNSKSEKILGGIEPNQNEKSVNLCLTTPFLLECIFNQQISENNTPKDVDFNTVSIQTEPIVDKELMHTFQNHFKMQKQVCEPTDNYSNAASVQAESDLILSNCSSFKYLKGDDTNISISPLSNHTLQIPQQHENYSTIREDSNSSVETSISSKAFDQDDIVKITTLLQNLHKSKKYNANTKKHYIKKLLQKIIESKSSLEESSNSSELFLPKQIKTGIQNSVKLSSTDSSSKSRNEQETFRSPGKGCQTCSPRKLISRILLKEKNSYTHKENMSKKKILPLQDKPILNTKSSVQTSNSTLGIQHDSIHSSSSKSDSKPLTYQNWKEDKTHSEHVFETNACINGDSDYLNQVANREREYQLNWINNEIDHLEKLKKILQKCGLKNKSKKITSVYVVSDETDNSEDKKSNSSSKKKYIIETNLAAMSYRNRKFKIGDQNYIVEELVNDQLGTNDKTGQLLGDIKVDSRENTLNIKVTTFCDSCKKCPCVCTVDSMNSIEFKRDSLLHAEHKTSSLPISTKSLSGILCCHQKFDKHCPLCDMYNPSSHQPVSTDNNCHDRQISPLTENNFFLSSSNVLTHFENTKQSNNSLKRIFENCMCNSKSFCNCSFVNKLYQHLNTTDQFKSYKKQTQKEHIAIQTEFDPFSTEIQTNAVNKKDISLQTENYTVMVSETVGHQCNIEQQNQNSELLNDNFRIHGKDIHYDINSENNLIGDHVHYDVMEKKEISTQVSMKEQVSQVDLTHIQTRFRKQSLDDETLSTKLNEQVHNWNFPKKNSNKTSPNQMNTSDEYSEASNSKSSQQKSIQNTPNMMNSVISSSAVSLHSK